MSELMSHSSTKTPYVSRLAILLSTYNGEKYLSELLESIVSQEFHNWDLWIRDDGSSDRTTVILTDFRDNLKKTHPKNRVFIRAGENLGVVRSFFSLMREANSWATGYDGYAFCDQDDIWNPEKLQRAADHLKQHQADTNTTKPILYHTRQTFIDSEGRHCGVSPDPRKTGFANALIQNQVVGCTMVIDRSLCELILDGIQNHELDSVIMHDWWCYLTAGCFGEIMYDPEPSIRFRRHDDSTTPMTSTRLKAWHGRARALRRRSWSVDHIIQQADLFYRMYSPQKGLSRINMTDSQAHSIHSLSDLRNSGLLKRLHYLISSDHHRSTLPETYLFRFMILLFQKRNG